MNEGHQPIGWRRAIGTAGLVAIASWVSLVLTVGNVGLQRLVSGGAERVIEAPTALVAMFAVSALVAWYFGRQTDARGVLAVIALVLVADLGGALLAVALVGELEIDRLWLLMLVLSGYGGQLLGVAAGLVARRTRRSARTNPG